MTAAYLIVQFAPAKKRRPSKSEEDEILGARLG
jgi:hypothetical protein